MSDPLLKQFILESRDYLQRIGEILIALEEQREESNLLNELFRLFHTLKGNSGLFNFPSLTKLLHASEDLLNLLREGEVSYTSNMADILLEVVDLVSAMIDEIERTQALSSSLVELAEKKTAELREFSQKPLEKEREVQSPSPATGLTKVDIPFDFTLIPEKFRLEAVRRSLEGKKLTLIKYYPEAECFYKGEDPYFLVVKTPKLLWLRYYLREAISDPALMDFYLCLVNFEVLSWATEEELAEHYQYVLDQVQFFEVEPSMLIIPMGDKNGGYVYEDFVSEARTLLKKNDLQTFKNALRGLMEFTAPNLFVASVLRWIDVLSDFLPNTKGLIEALLHSLETMSPPVFSPELKQEEKKTLEKKPELPFQFFEILKSQKIALEKLSDIEDPLVRMNTLTAIVSSIENSLLSLKREVLLKEFREIANRTSTERWDLLRDWIEDKLASSEGKIKTKEDAEQREAVEKVVSPTPMAEKVLRVDEVKIDRLMNLVGEFVVAKNSLFYLAQKVGRTYEDSELSREIKAQYDVLNRISEEMQDAIMRIRMVHVSTVFQRFPRLVRDLSKKLNKKVKLIIEGEDTEADKKVIESLSEPLIHLIRNSLDHGIEAPEERLAQGKPETGTVVLRAKHEGDSLVIEVMDDGRGIDAEKLKLKAYQRGLITKEQMEKMTYSEATNLIFLPGLSSAEEVSDLSGRGVGMDVVINAVESFGGTVQVQSIPKKGTTIVLRLPLSMAVTQVMIFESAEQRYGVPIESIVETVRVAQQNINRVKGRMTTVLRNRIVPIFFLNDLLGLGKPPMLSEDGEFTLLVLSINDYLVGIVVDRLLGTSDIILKPFVGFLSNLKIFSGTAILGDGSVLLILNPKELLNALRI